MSHDLDWEVSINTFLTSCSLWGPRDLQAVRRKLAAAGVKGVKDLVQLNRDGALNDKLVSAGEKRFSVETLEVMRSAGDVIFPGATGLPATSRQASRGSVKTRGTLHGDVLFDLDDPVMLRQHICRGLERIGEVAAEAHRRNVKVAKCLEEVQADILRISERMSTARRQRQRDKAVVRPPTPPTPPMQRPSAPRSMPPEARHKLRPEGRRVGSAPFPEARSSPCARGAQNGFTFGPGPASTSEPKPPPVLPGMFCPIRNSIRAELVAMQNQNEVDRRSQLKRLLVKWHPDRNPDSVALATDMFQYIQQERSKLGL